jgi:predicted MFS family arabinose efflux permease
MRGSVGAQELKSGSPLIVACAIGVACSAIALPFYATGVVTKPIVEEFGWQRGDVQFAIMFSSGLGALTAPVTGWIISKWSARAVALPSLVGLSIGFIIAANASSLATFYLGYAFMALLGAGTNPVTWTQAITHSFEKKRGAALGLALVGTGLSALLVPIYVTWLEQQYGWRGAFYGLALLPLLIALPITIAWFRPTAELFSDQAKQMAVRTGVTLSGAVKDYRFWILAASILSVYLAVSGILTNLVPAITDMGISQENAALITGSLGISLIFGRIIAGLLMDRFWAPGVAAIILMTPVASCLIFFIGAPVPLLLFAALLLGLAAGAELDILAFLTACYFGLAHYANIYAWLYAALAIGSASAPTLFATIYDINGTYAHGFAIGSGFFAFGALSLLFLGPYPKFELSE